MKNMYFGAMDKKGFGDLLLSLFNVRCTKRELEALQKHFDKDGDGTVDFVEFKTSFFKLVREGKRTVKLKQKKAADRVKRRMDRLKKEHRNKHCRTQGAR